MPLDYRYEAVDAAGRRLNGTLTADSEKDARRKLFEQGLVVSKLQGEAKAKTSWDWRRLFNKPLSTTELILFTQQFRTLYMAGISLPEALRILHDQAENKQFKWVVGDMQRRVLEGESLANHLLHQIRNPAPSDYRDQEPAECHHDQLPHHA